jgi:hypothetical protein
MNIQFIAEMPDGEKIKGMMLVPTTPEDEHRNEKCIAAVQVLYPGAKVLGWIEVIV